VSALITQYINIFFHCLADATLYVNSNYVVKQLHIGLLLLELFEADIILSICIIIYLHIYCPNRQWCMLMKFDQADLLAYQSPVRCLERC